MYKRDFGILVLTVFAVYFALQNEGTFTFKKAWYYPISGDSEWSSTETLPKPVIVDLNGDGSLEIVAVTHDHRLIVLRARGVGREDGFAKGQLLAEVSLRPSGMHTLSGQKPVGLAAGYIDKPSGDLVHRPRKAVIVVMTENWHVTCFDHNLATLWTQDIRKEMHGHASILELGILITHHTVYEADRGLIIIGGSANIVPVMEEEDDEEVDPFEKEREIEQKEQEMIQRLGEDEKEKDLSDGQLHGADVSRKVAYYAFDGASGSSRWHYIGSEFKHDLDSLKEDLQPQRYYKLEAEHLSTMDYSEVSCRDYRESILHSLPHQWSQRVDTEFSLSHFRKHKYGKGARKKELASSKDRPPPKSPCVGKNCRKDAVAQVIGTMTEKATQDGRTSAPETQPPNAIVAHLMEGLEVIHLYTGRPICKLHLPEGGLHVDLNGDGVPDHIQATSGEAEHSSVASGHHLIPPCHAYATSGIPPNEPFFNGSICRNAWSDVFGPPIGNAARKAMMSLEIAPPAMLPIPTPRGEFKFRYGQRGYAVFLNSRGDVSAFNSRGKLKWMISTDCAWNIRQTVPRKSRPTLKAFPLRTHAFPSAVLVAGSRFAEVISEHGNSLATFSLPEFPMLPLEIVDLNGDGLNDVLLISNRMIYGYQQVPNLGGRPFGMLVLCLIVAMGTIYAAQHTGSEPTRKIKRSTDRTD